MSQILIVDDNPDNLYLLEALLTGSGYGVTRASHGREALEVASTGEYGLVISDILMPVMDGFSLCKAWMADEKLSEIPFVFYTATYTDPKDERFAISLGAARFMVKPAEPNALLAMVSSVLAGEPGPSVGWGEDSEDAFYFREYNATLIRKLEAKLHELTEWERRLSMALRAGSVGIWEWDVGSDIVRAWNLRQVSGREPAGHGLEAYLALIAEEDQEEIRGRLKKNLEGQSFPDGIEFRVVDDDGNTRWLWNTSDLIKDSEGNVQRIVGTLVDISRSKLVELQLRESRAALRQFALKLDHIQDQERKAVARDIHDEIGQGLTVLSIDLERIRAGDSGRIDVARDAVVRMIEAVQDISVRMRPTDLEQVGLRNAIDVFAAKLEERSGVRVEVTVDEAADELAERLKEALYKVMSEACTNVIRHAGAESITIRIEAVPNGVHLSVRDDGCGISDEAVVAPSSVGLVGMRERMLAVGGRFGVSAIAEGGTEVVASVPR